MQIAINIDGLEYKVRYFFNGGLKEYWLLEQQLQAVKIISNKLPDKNPIDPL